jgi:hypothetical protein
MYIKLKNFGPEFHRNPNTLTTVEDFAYNYGKFKRYINGCIIPIIKCKVDELKVYILIE